MMPWRSLIFIINYRYNCSVLDAHLILSIFLFQYAHRKCVQRWCNEKGDITCEICHQVNYVITVIKSVISVVIFNLKGDASG